ncbi:MAG: hypothetical protein JNM25_00945 [Planctomycetes bacterium]|nr:hypothetical protein [Planctomycetota bacterium]
MNHRGPTGKLLAGALLIGAMAVSLWRTARAPNDWAEAHWLLDYRFGFVKRGLPGQLLTWVTDLLGVPVTEPLVAAVAGTVLAVFVAVVLAMAWRIVRAADGSLATVAATVAFLTSPFAVLIGHLNGYFDHIFFVLGAASLVLALRGHLLAGAVVQVVALLVHESCILLIYPAFVLACLVRPAGDGPLRKRLPWVPLLLPVLMAGAIAVVLSSPPAGFQAGYQARLRASGFVVGGYEDSTPWMLTMPLRTMWELVSQHLGELLDRHLVAVGLVVPNLVALVLGVGRHPALARRTVPMVAAAAVVLLPLSMHAVAWDAERIWTYSLFTTFAAAWILAVARPGAPGGGAWILPTAVLAIGVNLLCTVPLLDHAVDRLGLGPRLAALAALLLGLALLARNPARSR